MTRQHELATQRERTITREDEYHDDPAAMACPGSSVTPVLTPATCIDDQATGEDSEAPVQGLQEGPGDPHGHDGGNGAQGDRGLHGKRTLLRLLDRAREQRGSPSLWDAVAARLDAEMHRRDLVAPMSDLLRQIQERVDDETWRLILDFEGRFSSEVVAGVEVGLELGYENGRAAALLEAECVPGDAARTFTGRLADLLGDTEADYPDVVLALLATLEATVKMARGGQIGCKLGLVATPVSRTASTDHPQLA